MKYKKKQKESLITKNKWNKKWNKEKVQYVRW